MAEMEYLDEAVLVTTRNGPENEFIPQRLVWRKQNFVVVGVGRQWDEPDGRHILIETANGPRFELQLRRDDLAWRLKRVWWSGTVV
jgi:hypothetical protein